MLSPADVEKRVSMRMPASIVPVLTTSETPARSWPRAQEVDHERLLTSLQASKRIDLGPYGAWLGPARLYANVERAYREFRSEPADAPWDMTATFDAIYGVARARRCEVEF